MKSGGLKKKKKSKGKVEVFTVPQRHEGTSHRAETSSRLIKPTSFSWIPVPSQSRLIKTVLKWKLHRNVNLISQTGRCESGTRADKDPVKRSAARF